MVRAFALCSRSALLRLAPSARAMSTYKPDIEAVKKLRAASEAPLKDVKNALVATNGDFPAAFEWLRKKGIARASAKAGRTTAEGLIGVHVRGTTGAMVEINSETDFVAMNDKFQDLVKDISAALADSKSSDDSNVATALTGDALGSFVVPSASLSVAELVPELVGKVGENVVARRAVTFHVDDGAVCSYVHNVAAPGLGRAAALVALQFATANVTTEQTQALQSLGHRLAMHIVAAKPLYLSRETVPEPLVAKERAFLAEQVATSGKPAHIVEKMTEGRLTKFFSECTLLEQEHFIETGNPKVGAFIESEAKRIGVDVTVAAYERFEVGEGSKDDEKA